MLITHIVNAVHCSGAKKYLKLTNTNKCCFLCDQDCSTAVYRALIKHVLLVSAITAALNM